MALYCAAADLVSELGEKKVAELARDDGTTVIVISDSAVQARLTYYITNASNSIRSMLHGRADMDAVAPGSQLAADLRRWCTIFVLEALYRRRGHFTEQSNPYKAEKALCVKEIDNTRQGFSKVGEGQPDNSGWSSSADINPSYAPVPEGGGGTSENLLEGF